MTTTGLDRLKEIARGEASSPDLPADQQNLPADKAERIAEHIHESGAQISKPVLEGMFGSIRRTGKLPRVMANNLPDDLVKKIRGEGIEISDPIPMQIQDAPLKPIGLVVTVPPRLAKNIL